jgi:hypothetical protein
MGKIDYPIDNKMITIGDSKDHKAYQAFKNIVNTNMVVHFEIGDLEINAGRESLEYTENTQQAIWDRVAKIQAEILAGAQKEFDSCKTMYDAKKMHNKVFGYDGVYYNFSQYFNKNDIKYKGETVGNAYWEVDYYRNENLKKFGFYPMEYRRRSNTNQIRNGEETYRMVANDDIAYVVCDIEEKQGVLNRIVPLLERDNNDLGKKFHAVYLIKVKDRKLFDAWVKDKRFDAKTVKLEKLTKVKLSEIYPPSAKTNTTRSKSKSKVFTLDLEKKHRYHDCPKSDYFKEETLDLTNSTDLYVVVDRFYVQGAIKELNRRWQNDADPSQVAALARKVFNMLDLVGDKQPRIVAVRKKNKELLGKKMVCLFEWMKTKITEKAKAENIAQKIAEYRLANDARATGDEYQIEQICRAFEGKTNGVIQQHCETRKRMTHKDEAKKIEEYIEFYRLFDIKGEDKKSENILKQQAAEIRERYPMLFLVDTANFRYNFKEFATKLIDYVRQMDKLHGGSENEREQASVLATLLPLTLPII